jgi:hypothetical protein
MSELFRQYAEGRHGASVAPLLLPAAKPCKAVVRHMPPTPPATHIIRFSVRDSNRDETYVLGAISTTMDDRRCNERAKRIEALVRYRLHSVMVEVRVVPTEWLHERRVFSDVERFRRKMLRVQRAYEDDRAAILNGEGGLFQDDRLRELDALLEQAWQKMEQRYGVRRDQLDDPVLMARVRELRERGVLDLREHATD